MSKRRVSAKLHHEIKEYSSLLRALRVRDTMDITKHLKAQKNPFALTPKDVKDEEDGENADEDEDLEDLDDGTEILFGSQSRVSRSLSSDLPDFEGSPIAGPSNAIPTPKSVKARGKEKAADSKPKQRRRDHWTRWPLLLNDVLKPEWTLEDEVAFIVSQLLKTRPPRPDFPVPPAGPNDPTEEGDDKIFALRNLEFDEEDPDPPFYVPYITAVVAEYLSTLLGLLAAHTPARGAGLQNRIEPLNWRAVIDVVVLCGIPEFSNPKTVSNVITRMEAIYGPSILPLEGYKATSYRAVERMADKEAAEERFEKSFNAEVTKYRKFDPLMRPDKGSFSKQTYPNRLNKQRKKEEREFRTRSRWTGPVEERKNASKAKAAAAAASKKKKATGKEKEKEKAPEIETKSPAPAPPLPTPPPTQSEAGPSTTWQGASLRRSARPSRTLNYNDQMFLPPDEDIVMKE